MVSLIAMNGKCCPNKGTAFQQELSVYDMLIKENWLKELVEHIRKGDDEAKKKTMEGLKKSASYARHQLAARMNLRNTPELTFILDNSIEYGAAMSKRIDDLVEREAKKRQITENKEVKERLTDKDFERSACLSERLSAANVKSARPKSSMSMCSRKTTHAPSTMCATRTDRAALPSSSAST